MKIQVHFIFPIPMMDSLGLELHFPKCGGGRDLWGGPKSHEGVFQDQDAFKKYSKTLLAFWPSFSHGTTMKFPEAPMICAARLNAKAEIRHQLFLLSQKVKWFSKI